MRMSEKCCNKHNYPLTSRRTDGGKKWISEVHLSIFIELMYSLPSM